MKTVESADCVGTLLDILCYEMLGGRLSPETEQLFRDHILACRSCREGVRNYLDVLLYGQETASAQVC